MELYEKREVVYIINSFNIFSNSIEEIGDDYLILSDEENFILKKFKEKENKIQGLIKLNEDLVNAGFRHMPIYVKNKVGNKYVMYNKKYYSIQSIANGESIKLRNLEQCSEGVKLLAHFHKVSKELNLSRYGLKNNTGKWINQLIKRRKSLMEFRELTGKRILKTPLDQKYYELTEFNIELIDIGLSILKECGYNSIIKVKRPNIIIDKFYSDILVKKDNLLYFTNIDYVKIDFDFYDLGKFIRRIMFKREFLWNFDDAKKIIESYEEENSLTREEKMMMLAIIIYPSKFYRMGKSYYRKCYLNTGDNGLDDLNRIEENMNNISRFVEEYYKYYAN